MNHFFMELKEVGEAGTFRGIASVYDVEDLGGDVINKGAFTKTLAENEHFPILWQHDAKQVIGIGSLKEWGQNVSINGRLDMLDPMGQYAHRKMKGDKENNLPPMIKGLSIGYSVPDGTSNRDGKTGIRHITEVKLWEVSVVTFPMNPLAQITGVKDHDDLLTRLSRAEEEITALKAKLLEPPNVKGAEPGNHSRALYLIESLRLGLAN